MAIFLDSLAAREVADALRLCSNRCSLPPGVGATDITSAVAAALRARADVVIAGFATDDPAGAGLLAALQAGAPELPVIFYVPDCADAAAAAALRGGAADVITGPAPGRLAAAIDRAIALTEMRHSLAQAQKDLAGAHHADFLPLMMDVLAHDLRNMLQPLTFAAQILKRSTDTMLQPLHENLGSATQRGLDIVAAMLAFGSDRSRGRGVIDVQDLMRTLRLLLPDSLARRVAISCESTLVTLHCSAQQFEIEQCLLALARRALRQLPDGGALAVRVERRQEAESPVVSFAVEVQGAGLAAPATPDSRELLLCRVLAARHGGLVRRDHSGPGRETIEVLLPLLQRTGRPDTGLRSVLLAAGQDAAQALAETGTAAGFQVIPVTSSAAAEEYLINALTPDFAIIDADLPQLEGARVFSLLRARGFSGRIVLLTSPGSELSLDNADDAVFQMTKPADGARLFGALDGDAPTATARPDGGGAAA